MALPRLGRRVSAEFYLTATSSWSGRAIVVGCSIYRRGSCFALERVNYRRGEEKEGF